MKTKCAATFLVLVLAISGAGADALVRTTMDAGNTAVSSGTENLGPVLDGAVDENIGVLLLSEEISVESGYNVFGVHAISVMEGDALSGSFSPVTFSDQIKAPDLQLLVEGNETMDDQVSLNANTTLSPASYGWSESDSSQTVSLYDSAVNNSTFSIKDLSVFSEPVTIGLVCLLGIGGLALRRIYMT
ncbi:MAG: hypothetical protein JXR25_01745 [Pontiellaceae bacterium]|nr:hypothetical protein [Pontiellaceae bacterium]MBN2783523.1 hypothetical protein [Pontiellaceae bacterium]